MSDVNPVSHRREVVKESRVIDVAETFRRINLRFERYNQSLAQYAVDEDTEQNLEEVD